MNKNNAWIAAARDAARTAENENGCGSVKKHNRKQKSKSGSRRSRKPRTVSESTEVNETEAVDVIEAVEAPTSSPKETLPEKPKLPTLFSRWCTSPTCKLEWKTNGFPPLGACADCGARGTSNRFFFQFK